MTVEHSFWTFVGEHNNRIRSLTFDVAAPNMFNDRNDFQNEMRLLRDRENVSKVKTTLESDTILNTDSERLKDIVDYTERGAGEVSATADDGAVYRSGDHAKKVTITIEHHTNNLEEFLRQIVTLIGRIFL